MGCWNELGVRGPRRATAGPLEGAACSSGGPARGCSGRVTSGWSSRGPGGGAPKSGLGRAGAPLAAEMNPCLSIGPRGPTPVPAEAQGREAWPPVIFAARGGGFARCARRVPRSMCRGQRALRCVLFPARCLPAVRVYPALGASRPASPSVWRVLVLPRSDRQGPQVSS